MILYVPLELDLETEILLEIFKKTLKGAKIQLLDLPGIIEGAKDGKGRGKQVIAVARTCHLIFIW